MTFVERKKAHLARFCSPVLSSSTTTSRIADDHEEAFTETMTHGMCCGGASSIRMLANAKKQKTEETAAAKSKDTLKQEKANASKFQDKIKRLSGTFSFKSKKEPKA